MNKPIRVDKEYDTRRDIGVQVIADLGKNAKYAAAAVAAFGEAFKVATSRKD